ncbi:hypothetical protein [Ectobacillus ponti]|uniref:hypothetical protein n=1 Tax=Ectobacillus ponti TaxID=2961894 RepID=UPI003F67D8A0
MKQHLDAYKVDVPDFPRKRSRADRLLRFLTSPASNPVEPLLGRDMTAVVGGSLLVAIPLLLLPLLLQP